MSECKICNGLQVIFAVRNNRMVARPCPKCIGSECKECGQTGILHYQDENGNWFSKDCRCLNGQRKAERLSALHIPGNYFDATFENFDRAYQKNKLRQAIDAGRQFVAAAAAAFPPPEPVQTEPVKTQKTGLAENDLPDETQPFSAKGLLLFGSPGTGKTRLMCVILKTLILETSLQARFIEFSALISDIKNAYDRGEPERDLIDPLIEADILGIDELGKGRRNEWSIGIIDEIITGRYNAGKTTLFTTNYNPKVTHPGYPGSSSSREDADDIYRVSLTERLNYRIFSRLLEVCDWIDMNFEDYRTKDAAFLTTGNQPHSDFVKTPEN